MSKTRSIIVICLGLFLAGSSYIDSLDGTITSANRSGSGRSIHKASEPDAFRSTLLFHFIAGIGVASYGFYCFRKQ